MKIKIVMNKTYLIISIFLFLNCKSDGFNKQDYLKNFSTFIEKLEFQKTSKSLINWDNKLDSLKILESDQSKYRLSSKEEEKIKFFVEKFNLLRNSENVSEMRVNFYFENSLSMNGYLSGKNFKQVLHRIFGNLNDYPLNSYFVNTKEHKQDNILYKIDNKSTNVGDTGNSDHQFIFGNAIKNASNNNLSIVVTDGIYSVKNGDVDVVSIDIENTFKSALADNEIETVVLKLSSNFNGTYYSETCKPGKKSIKINQNRPYYIILFGETKSIDKALKEITVINELPGFEEQARFFLTKNLKSNYTILSKGEEKHGQFRASKRGTDLIVEIEDVEKFERPGFNSTPKNEDYFQIGIAVDFSKVSLPNSYLEDLKNYWINDQLGYSLSTISNVSELNKNSKTYKEIQRINNKNKTNFTHVFKIKANKDLYGNLQFQLKNNLPAWIKNTGVKVDCNIINDTSQTFAFDQLMTGISKAYQKVNKNNPYLNFNLNIKP